MLEEDLTYRYSINKISVLWRQNKINGSQLRSCSVQMEKIIKHIEKTVKLKILNRLLVYAYRFKPFTMDELNTLSCNSPLEKPI